MPHRGLGTQGLGPTFVAFPGNKQGVGSEVEWPGLELVPHGTAGPVPKTGYIIQV